jgi:hypothetical protein
VRGREYVREIEREGERGCERMTKERERERMCECERRTENV